MTRFLCLALLNALLHAQVAGNSASALFSRGMSLARSNNLAQAADIFEEGARLFPADKRFPLELAGIAWREKDGSKAKRYLHQSLQIDPQDTYGNDFLATLYLFDHNAEAALKYWNRVNKPLIETLRFEPDPPLSLVLRDRTFDISAGQVFTLKRLETSWANLNRLDVLNEVRFDLVPRPDDRFDLAIRAIPTIQPLGGWLGRVLPMLRELPYQGIDVESDDIRRNALNFTSLWRWDPDKRRVNLSMSGPLHSNPREEFRYFVDARDETWDLLPTTYRGGLNNLLVRRTEAGASYELGLSPRLQWTLGGVLKYRDYGNEPAGAFFQKGWSAELNNRFDYLLWTWPDHRIRLNTRALLNTGHLFAASPARLITARAGLVGEWRPSAKGNTYRLAEQTQVGRIFGNAPLDELFMLGMERDNETGLWLRGISGAYEGRKGSAPLGREYAISQTDFERKLFQIPFIRLEAGTFFDVGSVGDHSGQFGSHGVLYATGVQVQVKTVSGVHVKLVYGRDLVSGLGVFYTGVSR
ncbi:MAG: tetratricopeptide repeat protein [Acidobacteriota bacterium]|nr:tetratricopeptide repeat protein [Acidobacteriota bacterium]